MAYEFKFPDIGEGITEGEIVEWTVKEGDYVKEHQALGKIETDKAVAEIPSPVAGYILKIHHAAGDTVHVGETLVTIGEKGEKISAAVSAPVAAKVSATKQATKQPVFKPAGAVGYLEEAADEEVAAVKKLQKELKKEAKRSAMEVLATPATRRVARELRVNLAEIKGTGLGGRITEQDVRNVAEAGQKTEVAEGAEEKIEEVGEAKPELIVEKKYDMYGYVERVPLKGVRKDCEKNDRGCDPCSSRYCVR